MAIVRKNPCGDWFILKTTGPVKSKRAVTRDWWFIHEDTMGRANSICVKFRVPREFIGKKIKLQIVEMEDKKNE